MRVLKAAKVVNVANWTVVDCTLRNLTDTEAMISCGDQFSIPDDFSLLIPSDNSIQKAKVVWRIDRNIGMQLYGEKTAAPARKH